MLSYYCLDIIHQLFSGFPQFLAIACRWTRRLLQFFSREKLTVNWLIFLHLVIFIVFAIIPPVFLMLQS